MQEQASPEPQDGRAGEGANAAMGDTADFEKMTALEARLSAALDRIATRLSARPAPEPSGTEADDARVEAETRAKEAEDRVVALEARLAETQDALSETQSDLQAALAAQAEAPDPQMMQPGSDAAALVALEGRLAEVEAARGLAMADLAERDAALAEAKAKLAEKDALLAEAQLALEAFEATQSGAGPDVGADTAHADTTPPLDADLEDMEKALAVMGRRVERARAERDAARAACDAVSDLADELREASGADPEERVLELRRELRLMRTRAEDLAAEISLLHSAAGVDVALLDQGLRAEVEALRHLREADAAELDRIVQELQAGLDQQEGTGHA